MAEYYRIYKGYSLLTKVAGSLKTVAIYKRNRFVYGETFKKATFRQIKKEMEQLIDSLPPMEAKIADWFRQ
jgi:excinuclease UvrABC helicase subunit UvrB